MINDSVIRSLPSKAHIQFACILKLIVCARSYSYKYRKEVRNVKKEHHELNMDRIGDGPDVPNSVQVITLIMTTGIGGLSGK